MNVVKAASIFVCGMITFASRLHADVVADPGPKWSDAPARDIRTWVIVLVVASLSIWALRRRMKTRATNGA